MFKFNRKEEKLREERALAAILKAFEAESKSEDANQNELANKEVDTKAGIDLETLVEFLVEKKLIDKKEWESFIKNSQKK